MRVPRVFLALLCGGAISLAQNAPSAQTEVTPNGAPATFSSRVNLVSVPVVIRDRDGRSVGNLKQEDFQLLDKGKPQLITKFTIEQTSEATLNRGPSASPAAAVAATPAEPSKPVLPSKFVAYFFDDVHMQAADLLNARQAANRQLERTLDPNTRAAVFTTSGRFTQDFTSDAQALHSAINRIQPWSTSKPDKEQDCIYISYYVADQLVNKSLALGPGRANVNDPLMRAVLAQAAPCVSDRSELIPAVWAAAQRALNAGRYEGSTALTTIQDLIRSMSSLPGTRTIVMVSPGFIFADDQRFVENDIFDKAIRANVVINTLDVRGLYTPPGMQASDKGYRGSASAAALMQADNDEATVAGNTLAEFAAATGGAFFHNDNGLEEGLDRLAARPSYIYVLGFSPDNLKYDGSYHSLKVKVKDRANLEVEARQGYWVPNHAVSPAEETREEIHDVVFSREEMSEIPIKLNTEYFKHDEVSAELDAETRIDVKGLKFSKSEDRNRDSLTVVTSVFNQNGRMVAGTQRSIDLKLLDQTLDAARNSGMKVRETFNIAPGSYIVRVVVRDGSGRTMAAHNEGVEIQ